MSKLSDLVQDYNIADMDLMWLFNQMSPTLMKAFDNETSYDMRVREQMVLDLDHSSYDLVRGKDGELYPKIIMNVIIKDYDWMLRQVIENSAVHFECSFTPFTCSLDRDICTHGIYSGYDKELTSHWRKILNYTYPEIWAKSFKKYVERIKKLKIEASKKVYDDSVLEAEKEYNEEINNLHLYE